MNTALIPDPEEFKIINDIAKTAYESAYFNKLGGLPGILSITLYAREIGVPPMMALMGGFSNVQGKITMSAELMNMLIRRAGHKMKTLQCTNEICEIQGERGDTKEPMTVRFSFKEAQAAGLVKGGSAWEKYPSDMLFARCISRLRRRLFPDVATRSYVEGELDEPMIVEQQSQVIEPAKEEPKVEEPKINEFEALRIEQAMKDEPVLLQNMLKFYKVSKVSEIPESKLEIIWKNIHEKVKAKLPLKEIETITEETIPF